MKTLFPEMDKAITEDRLAQRREEKQRARDYLRDKAGYESWLIIKLTKDGPTVDANMMLEISELADISDGTEIMKSAMTMITVAHAMWLLGKLSKEPAHNHPAGPGCFLYGLRKASVRRPNDRTERPEAT